MKKGSQSRKCGQCGRVIMWLVPDRSVLGVPSFSPKKLLDFRFVKEHADGSGKYYCMDCLRTMFPGKY